MKRKFSMSKYLKWEKSIKIRDDAFSRWCVANGKRIVAALMSGAFILCLLCAGCKGVDMSAADIHNQFPEHSGGWLLPAPTNSVATNEWHYTGR